jgi:hypothetical protein
MRSLVSFIVAALSLWLFIGRVSSELFSFQFQIALLRVEAKCPGLPGGSSPGHIDFIDIVIDVGLTVVAAVFIALTIRDIRRRRNFDSNNDESQEGDEL